MSAPEEFAPPSVIYSSCYILSPCKWHLWSGAASNGAGECTPGGAQHPRSLQGEGTLLLPISLHLKLLFHPFSSTRPTVLLKPAPLWAKHCAPQNRQASGETHHWVLPDCSIRL